MKEPHNLERERIRFENGAFAELFERSEVPLQIVEMLPVEKVGRCERLQTLRERLRLSTCSTRESLLRTRCRCGRVRLL